jgi:hypothetical protein
MSTQMTFLKPGAVDTIVEEAAQDFRDLELPISIPALFNGGVPGFYFVTDKQYLYQDRAGTIPVTAVGDPVRAIRDSIYGILAAVLLDDAYHTYVEVNGEGRLLNVANVSRGFEIPYATLDPFTVFGGEANDPGFFMGARFHNLHMPGGLGEEYSGYAVGAYVQYGWLGNMLEAYSWDGLTNFYGPNIYPANPLTPSATDYFGVGLVRNTTGINGSNVATLPVVLPNIITGWTRNNGFMRYYLNEQPDLVNPPFIGWNSNYPSGGYSNRQILTEPFECPPLVDIAAFGTQRPIDIFGYTGFPHNIVGLHARSSLVVGKAVDPVLHQRILDSI